MIILLFKQSEAQGLFLLLLTFQFLQGVFCSLRQLLEEGFFHADPHPGNLVVTRDGKLAYFDFGMMGDFPEEYRIGFIRTVGASIYFFLLMVYFQNAALE